MKNKKHIIGGIILVVLLAFGAYHLTTKKGSGPGAQVPETFPNEKIAELEQKIKDDKDEARPYFLLAFEYYALENYDRALYLYDKYAELKPDDTTTYLNMGNIYIIQQDWDNAEKSFKNVLAINAKELKAYGNLIDIYEFSDNVEAIRSVVADLKVIEDDREFNIGGETAQAIALQARAYKLLKEYDNSIEYYQKMLDLNLSPSPNSVREQIKILEEMKAAQ